MRADLHTHSARSDGALEPAELVRRARQAGLDVVALTDHDSVAGLDEARWAGAEEDIEVIAGVELSVRTHDSDDHLLGLFVDPTEAGLVAYLDELQAKRRRMAEETLAVLERLGVPVDARRVAELASGAVVTRPHIARALVEAGHVASEQEAFERYLGSSKPAAIPRPGPDAVTAIALVRAAGGVAVLAHPVFRQDPGWQQRLASIPERLDQLQAAGLQAVECYFPDATPEITAQLLRWTTERGLIATGGTDYHGPDKAPFAPLGAVSVDADVVDALRAASSRPS